MTAKERLLNCIESEKELFEAFSDGSIGKQIIENLDETKAQALLDVAAKSNKGREGSDRPEAIAAFICGFIISWSTVVTEKNGKAATREAVSNTIRNNIIYDGTEGDAFYRTIAVILSGDTEEHLKSFKSVAPDKYLIPTGKVPRGITERESGAALVIPEHGKTPAVKTSFILSFATDEAAKIFTRKHISKFDMAILCGVISLLACGNIAITPAMAYRTAAGWGTDQLGKNHAVTPAQEERAEKSIERLRVTLVDIDATEEIEEYCKKNGLKAPKTWRYNEPLLMCGASEITTINGKRVKAYLFDNYDKNGKLKIPHIMRYAQISGQILALPMELSDMPISATESNIVLKNYLWVQIGAIKNTKTERRQEISYEGIYKELGIDIAATGGRVKAQRAREATAILLENWKKKGAIKNFSVYKKEKKPAGVRVEA